MIKKVLFTTILLFVLAYNGAVIYMENNYKDSKVYDSKHKVWISRGLYNSKSEQNSIKSINRAFESGASGVEVDFHYDVKMNRFIVSHDHPKKDKNGKLIYAMKDSKLLTLEKLFQENKEYTRYFWLDYKNLDKLTTEQTLKAIKRLNQISKYNALKKCLYIEGSNPLKLALYTNAGFHTILGIHPLAQNNIFSNIVLNGYKIAYFFKNISAIAMPYGDINNPIYSNEAQKTLNGIPIFLFHVPNNDNLLKALVQKNDIRVMLVGRDESINKTNIIADGKNR